MDFIQCAACGRPATAEETVTVTIALGRCDRAGHAGIVRAMAAGLARIFPRLSARMLDTAARIIVHSAGRAVRAC